MGSKRYAGQYGKQVIAKHFIVHNWTERNRRTGENTIPLSVIISGMAFYWQNNSAGKYLQEKKRWNVKINYV